jgi:hypothetical protein
MFRRMRDSRPLPRGSLAALSLLHALVFTGAAVLLPWPTFSAFALAAGLLATSHALTFALSLLGSPARARAWRASSVLALGFLAYLGYAALGSGLYIANLYDGVGLALLGASFAAFSVGVLFTVPLAAWGIAATGGMFPNKGAGPASGPLMLCLIGLSLAFGIAHEAHRATGRSAGLPMAPSSIDDAVALSLEGLPFPALARTPSLFTRDPVDCPLAASRAGATIFLGYIAAQQAPLSDLAPRHRCIQASSLDEALAAARRELDRDRAGGPVLVDVVRKTRVLPEAGPLLGAVVLRPGLDGVCRGARCLTPMQLVGLDQFTKLASFSSIQLDLGVEQGALRRALGEDTKAAAPAGAGFGGLEAFDTKSYVRHEREGLVPLVRQKAPDPRFTPEEVDRSVRAALAYVSSSQAKDGRFRYMLDPYTGKASFDGFSVPRQAGTTLATCELADFSPRAKENARRSVRFLASLEQIHGQRSAIVFPKGAARDGALGPTALTMISMLACRSLVGPEVDATIERLGRMLLALQREDGGFHPAVKAGSGEIVRGRDPMYAAGQAVMALVMWQGAKGEGLERPGELAGAVERAMSYYANEYWDVPLYDFFFLEENWHCLAAREALEHHRNDDYERFCIDYVTMKERFIQTEASGIDPELVGAYSFGHVFPPHHTATAGFGEALAAKLALLEARGVSTERERETMATVLKYLLRHQHRELDAVALTKTTLVVGAYSEHVGSAEIRIDYVQHAVAAMGHGGRALGLLPPARKRSDPS